MTPTQRRRFYQTPAWRAMSRHVRQRDKYLCQGCLPRTVAARAVHHIVPIADGGERLKESNLISLCADCHRDRHGPVVDEGKREWVSYIKDLMGWHYRNAGLGVLLSGSAFY